MLPRMTPAFLIAVLACPAAALTPDQSVRVALYMDLQSACSSVAPDHGQCQTFQDLHNQLLSEGLCFTPDEHPAFSDCSERGMSAVDISTDPLPIVFDDASVRQAFNSLDRQDRRFLQRKMMEVGFYQSGIDGMYGPGTAKALVDMAQLISTSHNISLDLSSPRGAGLALQYMLRHAVLKGHPLGNR